MSRENPSNHGLEILDIEGKIIDLLKTKDVNILPFFENVTILNGEGKDATICRSEFEEAINRFLIDQGMGKMTQQECDGVCANIQRIQIYFLNISASSSKRRITKNISF